MPKTNTDWGMGPTASRSSSSGWGRPTQGPMEQTRISWGGGPGSMGNTTGWTGNIFGGGAQPSSRFQHVNAYGSPIPIGSANYGALAGMTNFLGSAQSPQVRQQRVNYLQSLGIMPTVNGYGLDQTTQPGAYFDYSRGQGGTLRYGDQDAARSLGRIGRGGSDGVGGGFVVPQAQSFSSSLAAPPGEIGGAGGLGGVGDSIGAPGGLEQQLSDAYSRILSNGGSPFSGNQQALLSQRAADDVNRGTQDAVESARIDAARRGDESGSTLADVEARIRGQGVASANAARQNVDLVAAQNSVGNMLAALGGAGGYVNNRRQLELLLGNLQNSLGMNGLNLILGGA